MSLLGLLVWTVVNVVGFWIIRPFRPANVRSADIEKLALRFHRGALWCFNLTCVIKGEPCTQKPTLYISNHISYIDIFVLGSALPGTFIAKSEVAKWPLFGQLAKLQNTMFIERSSRRVSNQIDQVRDHLINKSNLILFPEGTSDIGTYVARFHSNFFQAAASADTEILIQPVTVAYSHYQGEKMDRQTRDNYAWYKPIKIVPHFLNGLGMGPAQVQLICHPVVKFEDFESRKDCAAYCETVIRNGLLEALELEQEVAR